MDNIEFYYIWSIVCILLHIILGSSSVYFYKQPVEIYKDYKKSYLESELRFVWNIIYFIIKIITFELFRLILILPILPFIFIGLILYDKRVSICKIFFKNGCG